MGIVELKRDSRNMLAFHINDVAGSHEIKRWVGFQNEIGPPFVQVSANIHPAKVEIEIHHPRIAVKTSRNEIEMR